MAAPATHRRFRHSLGLLLLLVAGAAPLTPSSAADARCFDRVFSFGDSLTDTGSVAFLPPGRALDVCLFPPYGETYFHHPTGRCSNGLLIIDFLAEAMGLPFLLPYDAGRTADDFRTGANFAVAGATAVSPAYLQSLGVSVGGDPVSLREEIAWFRDLLRLICNDTGCVADVMDNSLFIVGEIGGNDYNYPLMDKMPFNLTYSLVPAVIDTISTSITELIQLGAKTLIVPGDLPIGCLPTYLSTYASSESDYYDQGTGCIKWLNDFSQYHNQLLQHELAKLRKLHPNVTIVYTDWYAMFMEIFRDPLHFGFKELFKACCGGPGFCGTKGCNVCKDPSKFASWDGLHLTEAGYQTMTFALLNGNFTDLPITLSCSSQAHSSI